MYRSAVSVKPFPQYKYSVYILYAAFILGFVAGGIIVSHGSADYVSLTGKATSLPASIIALLANIIFSFSLTALILATGKSSLLIFLCFAQALFYGIVSSSVYFGYGAAQWLIRFLLLFTISINLICLLWFWSRHITEQPESLRSDFVLALSVSFAAAVLDHAWISPLLAKLLN